MDPTSILTYLIYLLGIFVGLYVQYLVIMLAVRRGINTSRMVGAVPVSPAAKPKPQAINQMSPKELAKMRQIHDQVKVTG